MIYKILVNLLTLFYSAHCLAYHHWIKVHCYHNRGVCDILVHNCNTAKYHTSAEGLVRVGSMNIPWRSLVGCRYMVGLTWAQKCQWPTHIACITSWRETFDVCDISPIFSLSHGGGADQDWATSDPRRGGSSRKTPTILGPDQQFHNLSAACLSPINYATTELLQQPVYHIPPLTLTTIFLPLLLKTHPDHLVHSKKYPSFWIFTIQC